MAMYYWVYWYILFSCLESENKVYAVSYNTGPCPDQLMPDSRIWLRTDDNFNENITVTCTTWDKPINEWSLHLYSRSNIISFLHLIRWVCLSILPKINTEVFTHCVTQYTKSSRFVKYHYPMHILGYKLLAYSHYNISL